jgi:hypothetical protein
VRALLATLLFACAACSDAAPLPPPVTVSEARLSEPEVSRREPVVLGDPGPEDLDELTLNGRVIEFPTQDEADAIAETRITRENFEAELQKLRQEIEGDR